MVPDPEQKEMVLKISEESCMHLIRQWTNMLASLLWFFQMFIDELLNLRWANVFWNYFWNQIIYKAVCSWRNILIQGPACHRGDPDKNYNTLKLFREQPSCLLFSHCLSFRNIETCITISDLLFIKTSFLTLKDWFCHLYLHRYLPLNSYLCISVTLENFISYI